MFSNTNDDEHNNRGGANATAPEEEDNDSAARAYRAIQMQIEEWTSPRTGQSKQNSNAWTDVGSSAVQFGNLAAAADSDDDGMVITNTKTASNSNSSKKSKAKTATSTAKSPAYNYERNVMDWWNRELVDPITNEEEEEEEELLASNTLRTTSGTAKNKTATATATATAAMTTPPKKSSSRNVVERAATPIMSNSSRKKQQQSKPPKYNISSGNKLLRHLEEVDDNVIMGNYGEENEQDNSMMMQVYSDIEDNQDEDEDMPPVNVQSPWMSLPPSTATATSTAITTPRAISPYRNQQYEYRRYHDALLTFLKEKRNLSDRIGMDREERALSLMAQEEEEQQHHQQQHHQQGPTTTIMTMTLQQDGFTTTTPSNTNTTSDPKLAQEETTVELDFLNTLKTLCWERDPTGQIAANRDWASRREGNFWALLQMFRSLGFAALLWANDDASMRQYQLAQSAFCETQATNIHASPKELIEGMTVSVNTNMNTNTMRDQTANNKNHNAPLILQRRKQILKWMEHCMDQHVSAETKASVTVATASSGVGDDDSGSNSNSNSRSANDTHPNTHQSWEKILESCLALILAGRLQDARILLRTAGYPNMATKLVGGAPAGVEKVPDEMTGTVEQVKVGNIHRSLWKRMMWKRSEQLTSNATEVPAEEAAIHSLLANDYRNALENPALRSWEKGLYAIFHAIWGRTEDELLHLHNHHRRRARPPFPGTQYDAYEREQLQATCQLASVSEWNVLEMLSVSPFAEMKGNDPLCQAIASLLVGQSALTDYLQQETNYLTNSSNDDNGDDNHSITRLRFITHLLLYLDSLSACTTPVSLEGINECKNQALFAYVEHLANHEDLWHCLVLYASMLPEHVLLDYFPGVLVKVEGEEERRMMIQQARELLPGNNDTALDLTLLRTVVRLMLVVDDGTGDVDTGMDDQEIDTNTPTRADVKKMKAIQWLCFYEEHMGDALIAANMLLRQFLLANKFASANMFLQDFLPDEVVEKVMTGPIESLNKLDQEDAITENESYQIRVGQARAEHAAFQSYLKAIRAMVRRTMLGCFDLFICLFSFATLIHILY